MRGLHEDYGGPWKELFHLCLREIKANYFDSGLKEHLSYDYLIIGLIMALSTLQNASIPRFLKEDHLLVPPNFCPSPAKFL